MDLKSAMVFLISLTVCQYVHSQLPILSRRTSEKIGFLKDYPDSDIDDETMNSTEIAGENYAKIGQFPFMAVITQLLNIKRSQCSGTIIDNKWVLTAGHCVKEDPLTITENRRFLVTFGIIDKTGVGYRIVRNGVSMITTRAFVHPNYTRGQVHNDIALLKMPKEILFSNTIQPIKLAHTNYNFVNASALVMGWGGSEKLKYDEVSVIENTECKRAGYPYNNDVTDDHVCAATGLGEDTCHSGAPLIVKLENSSYLQIGILGMSTCSDNVPEMFTSVSPYLHWINSAIRLLS